MWEGKLLCVCQKVYDPQSTMVMCHAAGLCSQKTRTDAWFHPRCVGEVDAADLKGDWWCPSCKAIRGAVDDKEDDNGRERRPILLSGVPVVPPALPAEFIPDASDLKAQRQSQAFRKAVRDNSRLHARPPAEVDWTLFQHVRQHLQSGAETAEVAEVKASKMIDFVLKFMQFTNKRLRGGDRDDLGLLEACSILDPALRSLNKPHREQYMNRLLEAFPAPDGESSTAMHTASVKWMMEDSYNEEAGVVKHFAALCQGKYDGMKAFGEWALNVLKNIPSNAIVESRFSTAAQVKPSSRMNLADKRLQGAIMMRDEPAFEEVQFDELLTKILNTPARLRLTHIKGKRAPYKRKQPG